MNPNSLATRNSEFVNSGNIMNKMKNKYIDLNSLSKESLHLHDGSMSKSNNNNNNNNIQ